MVTTMSRFQSRDKIRKTTVIPTCVLSLANRRPKSGSYSKISCKYKCISVGDLGVKAFVSPKLS